MSSWKVRDVAGNRLMRQIGLLLWIFALAASLAQSAPPLETSVLKNWEAVFGGLQSDGLRSMQRTSDGGFILGGWASSAPSGNKNAENQGDLDFWIVKTDAQGSYEWEADFGGSDQDYLHVVRQTSDAGFILGGSSFSRASGNKTTSNFGSRDFWIIKTDSRGSKQWEADFGSNEDEILNAILETSDGGFLIGGWSGWAPDGNKTSEGFGGTDFWILKLDRAGNKLWERMYGGSGVDRLIAIAPAGDDGLLLGGTSGSIISGNKTARTFGYSDFWLVRIAADGTKLWDKAFGGEGDNVLTALQRTRDGDFLVGGYSNAGQTGNKTSPGLQGDDFWVLRIDSDGNKIWERTFGTSGQDQLNALAEDSDGGFLLGGTSAETNGNKAVPGFGERDYWIIKLDRIGTALWQHVLGGDKDDVLYALETTPDGAVVAGGMTLSGVTGNKEAAGYQSPDFWVVQFTPRTAPVGTPVIFIGGKPALRGPVGSVGPVQVQLQTSFPQGPIFYTLDGSAPTPNSIPYSGPFAIGSSAVLRVAAFSSNFVQSAEADPLRLQITPLFALNTAIVGQGTIAVDPKQPSYRANASVQLTASPAAGWTFGHWSGDIEGTNRAVTLFMDLDKSVTAHFLRLWNLMIRATTGGSVKREPNFAEYPNGTTVLVTATPDPYFRFTGWSGDASGTTNSLELMMDANKQLIAQFVLTQITIAIEGAGQVQRSPNKPSYEIGETVTLTAVPAVGSAFVSWGDGSTTNPRTLLIGTNSFFEAIFSGPSEEPKLAILVNGQRTESATTNFNLAEITFQNPFTPPGTVFYTLDGSVPDLNSIRYTGPFVLRQNADLRASAFSSDFSAASEADPIRVIVVPGFSLTFNVTGRGAAARFPFQPLYASNSVVQLTVTPAVGWGFSHWSGDASGNTNALSVLVNRDLVITANFAPLLEVRTLATGGGVIVRSPDQSGYVPGSRVNLRAVSDPDFVFIGWTGPVGPGGTNNPLEVLVETNLNVTAHFTERIRPTPIQLGIAALPSFWVPDGPVSPMVATNGLLYLGGSFTSLSPNIGGAVALNKISGETEVGWPFVNGHVRVMVPDGTGGWFLGGQFDSVGSFPIANLVHLQGDRNVDMRFAPNPNGTVYELARTNQLLFVGGGFTQIAGQNRNFIAALDPATGQASTWDPDADRPIYVLAMSGNKIYAGGSFDVIGARSRSNIAALDAETGLATEWNPAADGEVQALQVDSNGIVYAAGLFRNIGGQPRSFLAALDAAFGRATDWNPAPDLPVRCLAVSGNQIYVGGEFQAIGGGVAARSGSPLC